jgi:hypothetical protein
LTGGKLFTYAGGTTTPKATYTTSSGAVANSNPIILDAAGRTPNEIWLETGAQYKFILKTSTDVTIGTYDNIPSINDPYAINSTLSNVTGTNAIAATATPTLTAYAAGAVYTFIAVNDNTGAATLSIDGLTAKSITKDGSAALTAGDIQAGKLMWVQYDGTTFQLINNIVYGGSVVNATISNSSVSGLTAPLGVTDGGTGLGTLTLDNVILGNGVSTPKFVAPGTSKNVLTSNGTTWTSAVPIAGVPTQIGQIPFSLDGLVYTPTHKIVPATVATATGTAVDFTGIPSWVKRITIMLAGVTVGGGITRLQLGTAGPTYVSSGYVGSYSCLAQGSSTQNATNFSSAFLLADSTLSGTSGLVTLAKVDGNTWSESSTLGASAARTAFGGGYITLSDPLVALRLSSTTGASFSAGSVNIIYE